MKIYQRGLVIGPAELIAALPPAATKVRSWDNSTAPKSQAEATAAMTDHGAVFERVFDAAHGRRYLAFAIRRDNFQADRRACYEFLTRASAS